jgi:hypothetical protein
MTELKQQTEQLILVAVEVDLTLTLTVAEEMEDLV